MPAVYGGEVFVVLLAKSALGSMWACGKVLAGAVATGTMPEVMAAVFGDPPSMWGPTPVRALAGEVRFTVGACPADGDTAV